MANLQKNDSGHGRQADVQTCHWTETVLACGPGVNEPEPVHNIMRVYCRQPFRTHSFPFHCSHTVAVYG